MKLSMWILADRLSHDVSRLDINDGSATISGTRFFSEKLSRFAPEYVYVGKGSDMFTDPDYNNMVILVHGYDLMFIEDQSVETVLNDVLAAFEFYNSWEASLWAASAHSDPIQHMVDLSKGVMPAPIGIADSAGRAVAWTKCEDTHSQDEGWRYFIENGIVPTSYTSARIRDVRGNLLRDWSAAPQIYQMDGRTCIGAQIMSGGEYVAAFYMQEYEKRFTPGDVQLAEVFCGVLSRLASMQSVSSEIKSGAAMISALLDGAEPDERVCARLDELIPGESPYQLVLIHSVTASTNIVRKSTLLETVKQAGVDSVSLIYGDDIVSVARETEAEAFLETLKRHVNLSHYVAGVSMPFHDWGKVLSRYRQAGFAIEQAAGGAGMFFYRDFAFEHLLAGIDGHGRELELTHPALDTLMAYDKKNGTELYKTLERYLTNERNMVRTAQELCIHRNSMKYRIRRIKERINCNLDDPEERLYLLLSYRLT
ncbi:MAG TPA: helix-turn-helix domain-containing protein [Clostridiales bacterium]|nr:helix-turn-helix domain-containing protein [Clostridiales bacterium]